MVKGNALQRLLLMFVVRLTIAPHEPKEEAGVRLRALRHLVEHRVQWVVLYSRDACKDDLDVEVGLLKVRYRLCFVGYQAVGFFGAGAGCCLLFLSFTYPIADGWRDEGGMNLH